MSINNFESKETTVMKYDKVTSKKIILSLTSTIEEIEYVFIRSYEYNQEP